MSIFKPGHLHIERHALSSKDTSYDVWIDYEPLQHPKEGAGIQFNMHGQIFDKEINESFFLNKCHALNFASNIARLAEKHGIPKNNSNIGSIHKYYDYMFTDIKSKLQIKPGDAVDIGSFE